METAARDFNAKTQRSLSGRRASKNEADKISRKIYTHSSAVSALISPLGAIFTLKQHQCRVLNELFDLSEEGGGDSSVYHAVVGGYTDVHA